MIIAIGASKHAPTASEMYELEGGSRGMGSQTGANAVAANRGVGKEEVLVVGASDRALDRRGCFQ